MANDIQIPFHLKAPYPIDLKTVVADIAARDAIPEEERFNGMIVTVQNDAGAVKTYQLKGGITNGFWEQFGGAPGPGGEPAVENRYADMPEMFAAQVNQNSGNLQYVADASGYNVITSGYAYYEYLGTTTGDETDYKLVSAEQWGILSPHVPDLEGPVATANLVYWVDGDVGDDGTAIPGDPNYPYATIKAASLQAYTDNQTDPVRRVVYALKNTYEGLFQAWPGVPIQLQDGCVMHGDTSGGNTTVVGDYLTNPAGDYEVYGPNADIYSTQVYWGQARMAVAAYGDGSLKLNIRRCSGVQYGPSCRRVEIRNMILPTCDVHPGNSVNQNVIDLYNVTFENGWIALHAEGRLVRHHDCLYNFPEIADVDATFDAYDHEGGYLFTTFWHDNNNDLRAKIKVDTDSMTLQEIADLDNPGGGNSTFNTIAQAGGPITWYTAREKWNGGTKTGWGETYLHIYRPRLTYHRKCILLRMLHEFAIDYRSGGLYVESGNAPDNSGSVTEAGFYQADYLSSAVDKPMNVIMWGFNWRNHDITDPALRLTKTGNTDIPNVEFYLPNLLPEAPADGTLYGRKDKAWLDIKADIKGPVYASASANAATEDGTYLNPFSTLQGAIDAAPAWSVVIIPDGSQFNETVTINKQLTIWAPNNSNLNNACGNAGTTNITSSSVIISGLYLENCQNPSNSAHFYNCTIGGNAGGTSTAGAFYNCEFYQNANIKAGSFIYGGKFYSATGLVFSGTGSIDVYNAWFAGGLENNVTINMSFHFTYVSGAITGTGNNRYFNSYVDNVVKVLDAYVPVDDYDLVNKKFVDDSITNAIDAIPSEVVQPVPITEATKTDPLVISADTTIVDVTLGADMTSDWAPSAISGGAVYKSLLWHIIKKADVGIDIGTLSNVGFDDGIDWTNSLVEIDTTQQRATVRSEGLGGGFIQFERLIITDAKYIEP